ncbi:hypothetical protein T552_00810 [Pneumocystis carinii B80]|uniref:Uncharacterized protein n=1 Tax=Pneumocystis carinii (strain B80) TaxID=1408658 RepID=A0A0W4ZPQ0_PNEC8|nr:hypothetical protein T552_00810 [Pneumocystis carinii B80]KTW30337.1 hypothetical protein T552_00810 [Pneumocystis carinii B80]
MVVLESLSSTGIFNEEWSNWKDIFENRLKENLWLFELPRTSSDIENGIETEDGLPLSMSQSEKMLFDRIKNVLFSNFLTYPPHTVQRLAELLLSPKLHYKSLSKYLRAVEKTLMVTSTTADFKIHNTDSQNQRMNNNDSSIPNLTPVPWIHSDENTN